MSSSSVELRFYSAEKFEGAIRDGSGWYQAIDFLPAATSDLTDCPEHERVVIIYSLPNLPAKYIDNWVKMYGSNEVALSYDSQQVVVTAAEYGYAQDILNTFLQAVMGGKDIDIEG